MSYTSPLIKALLDELERISHLTGSERLFALLNLIALAFVVVVLSVALLF